MKREELEKAAFWDYVVCADCGATFDPEELAEGIEEHVCPECGSEQTVSAASVLKLIESLEDSSE